MAKNKKRPTKKKAAKAKAKEKAGKASASPVRKTGVVKAPAKTQKKPASVQAKVPAKRARKAASGSAEPTTPDEPAKAAAESNS